MKGGGWGECTPTGPHEYSKRKFFHKSRKLCMF